MSVVILWVEALVIVNLRSAESGYRMFTVFAECLAGVGIECLAFCGGVAGLIQ